MITVQSLLNKTCAEHPGTVMEICRDRLSSTGHSWFCLRCGDTQGSAPQSARADWKLYRERG